MTTIEDELRSFYAEQPGAGEVEARILDAFVGRSGDRVLRVAKTGRHHARRTALTWTAAGVSAAAVAAIIGAVVVLADRQTGTRPAAAGTASTSATTSPTTPVPATSTSFAPDPADGLTLASKSGEGPSTVKVPRASTAGTKRNVKILIGCEPINASFRVLWNGEPQFWGNCAGIANGFGGAFTTAAGAATVSIEVAQGTSWTVFVTQPPQ